ncbi:MAG: radical SAM protein [Muribaculaceae bacterium]|nr:radical SAM protein [Muribaculaceae bacterium]
MKKINEIFQSIQGEGCNTGIPSIFVRFSGCNLSCGFCDTRHQEGVLMTDQEIISEIKKYTGAMIILTGGEPSLQLDENFISELKKQTGLPIAIETNGTRVLPSGIDWITLSPKIGMSLIGDSSIKISRADEVKVVDIGQDLEMYFKLPCIGKHTRMVLQPCFVEDPELREQNTRRTIRRVLKDPRWRLSLQTHRLMGIR